MIKLEFTVDDLRVTTDEWNYILQARRVKEKGAAAGEEYWSTLGYYNSLQTLSKAIVEQFTTGAGVLLASQVDSLERVVERQVTKLSRALAKAGK